MAETLSELKRPRSRSSSSSGSQSSEYPNDEFTGGLAVATASRLNTNTITTNGVAGSSRNSDRPSEPSRKRAKVYEEVERMLIHCPASRSQADEYHDSARLVRDDTYYLQDGSCVLQVENTLFNVHRTLLGKDGSLFSSMFQLPQGEHEPEGTDAYPIVLQGDTVAEFKHFLWVLYALPHELLEVTSPQIDLTRLSRLIDIARISFKYHFKSLETWALDVITDHVTRKPSPIFSVPTSRITATATNTATAAALASPSAIAANGALISRLMRLGQLCTHERLLTTVITVVRALMVYSVQYAHLAMTLADELNLRALQGIAYFAVMQQGDIVTRGSPNVPEDAIVDEDGRLIVSPQQKLRLLSGYHRLTMLWEHLRATPLKFDHALACGATWHQHGCSQCWLDFWKEKSKSEAVLDLGLADVPGRLRAIEKEFARWGSATYMHNDCRLTVRKAIQDKIKLIEDALPDYFEDEET